MRRCPAPECRAIDVVLPGKKRTQRFDLRLLQPRKFADLQYPISLQFLRGCFILGIAKVLTVGEPLPRKARNERTFAYALGTVQHKHRVEFTAWVQYAFHSRA